jgi:hypothetical protein
LFYSALGRPSHEQNSGCEPEESALFAEAQNMDQSSDGLLLVYLVGLEGEGSD